MMCERVSVRLDALLSPVVVAPAYDTELHPLHGVTWPRGAAWEPRAGEPAMFDVIDEGELQTW